MALEEMTNDEDEFEDVAPEEPEAPEPEPEAEPEPQEAREEDDEEYGKKVQKRIAREVSKRKALEDKLAEQQAYIANLHSRMSGVEQHFQQAQAQKTETEFSQKLAQLKEARRKAYEEGDIEAYEKLDDEYLDAKAEALARKAAPQQAQKPQAQAPVQANQPPREQQDWLKQNASWFNADPSNAARVQAANSLFDVLKAEGFDETDPDTYQELDRRLASAGVVKARSKPQITAAPPNRYTGAAESKRGFSQSDAAIMRKYGLDPNDPKQRKAYMDRNSAL